MAKQGNKSLNHHVMNQKSNAGLSASVISDTYLDSRRGKAGYVSKSRHLSRPGNRYEESHLESIKALPMNKYCHNKEQVSLDNFSDEESNENLPMQIVSNHKLNHRKHYPVKMHTDNHLYSDGKSKLSEDELRFAENSPFESRTEKLKHSKDKIRNAEKLHNAPRPLLKKKFLTSEIDLTRKTVERRLQSTSLRFSEKHATRHHQNFVEDKTKPYRSQKHFDSTENYSSHRDDLIVFEHPDNSSYSRLIIENCKSSESCDVDYESTSTTSFPSAFAQDSAHCFYADSNSATNKSTLLVSHKSSDLCRKDFYSAPYGHKNSKNSPQGNGESDRWREREAFDHRRNSSRRRWHSVVSVSYHSDNSTASQCLRDEETFQNESEIFASSRVRPKRYILENTLLRKNKNYSNDVTTSRKMSSTPSSPSHHDLHASREMLITEDFREPSMSFDKIDFERDAAYWAKSLNIALTQNVHLKGQLTKIRKRYKRLSAQLCGEMDQRSKQHQALSGCIKQLQDVYSRVQQESLTPVLFSDILERAIKSLLDALLLQPQKQDHGVSSFIPNKDSTSGIPEHDQIVSPNTHDENCFTSLTDCSGCTHPQGASDETSYKTKHHMRSKYPRKISSNKHKSTSPSETDQSFSSMPENVAPKKEIIPKDEVVKQEAISNILIESSTAEDKESNIKRPLVPVLSFKENNIGCGSWLSGNQTQGDTYYEA